MPKSQRGHLSDLDDLMIRTPRGGEIPLREAAMIRRGKAYTNIKRREAKRVLSVEARVEASIITADEVNASLKKTIMQQRISLAR